jgi:NAD(P)-dependent dehydrogenase (short-subunit alcohol dehydrogenase family)
VAGRPTGLRTFEGAVALVTGGASGIGAALGRDLVGRGARAILADRDAEGVRAEAGRLQATGARVEAAPLDVRDAGAVEALVVDVLGRHGRLDYVFNNAGIAVGGAVRDLGLEDWREAVEVNLMGVVHGVRAAWPRMVDQGFGHVVNTASSAVFLSGAMAAPYHAAKAAVVALTRALRVEGGAHGVRASVLCPGVVRTAILVDGGRYGRLQHLDLDVLKPMWERLRPMDADAFARRALDSVARNRAVIVLPAWWRAADLLNRLAPSLVDALSGRAAERLRARRGP